jgi:cytochrome c2
VAPGSRLPQGKAAPATAYSFQPGRFNGRSLIPAGVLLAAVLGLQLLLTNLPYRPYASDQAQVEIVVRHRSGSPIQGLAEMGEVQPADQPAAQPVLHPGAVWMVLELDGQPVWDQVSLPSGRGRRQAVRLYTQVPLAAGEYPARLLLYEPADAARPLVLFDGRLSLAPGQVQRLAFEDQVMGGDPQAGEDLYYDASLGRTVSCRICHSLEPGQDLVGPSFAGIASRAAARVPGMGAEAYLRQSILEPNAYIVPGFPAGQMIQNLGETLSEQQIEDLIAFLMTLE